MSRRLDGELTSAAAAEFDEHLAGCESCRAEHAAGQRVWALLRHAAPIEAPDLRAAVEARLVAEAPRWRPLRAVLRPRFAGYAAAAAVIGLFVWAGAWAGIRQQGAATATHDGAVAELLSELPPGLEVVALLDPAGERP
jgi:anti-sigma factor RsiW